MKTGLKYAVLGLALISMGWFANEALRPEKAFAEKTPEYKADMPGGNVGLYNKMLNDYAKDGWRFHSSIGASILVFER